MGVRSWRNNAPAIWAERVVVGTTPIPLSAGNIICDNVNIKADKENTGNIFVGPQGLLSAAGANRFILYPSEGLADMRVNQLSVVWVVASVADQVLWVYAELPE